MNIVHRAVALAAMATRMRARLSGIGRLTCLVVGIVVAHPSVSLAAEDDFLVGQGDKLAIGVHRRPDLSGDFRVQPDGNLALPFVGPVPVAGLTLDAVRLAIVRRLREDASLLDPRISVEMVEGRPISVGGGVRRAGTYPFQIGMTVSDRKSTRLNSSHQ